MSHFPGPLRIVLPGPSAVAICRAADMSGLPVGAIHDLIRAGELFAQRIGHEWYVSDATLPLLRRLAAERRAGRPTLKFRIHAGVAGRSSSPGGPHVKDNLSYRAAAHSGPSTPTISAPAPDASTPTPEAELRANPVVAAFLDGLRVDQRPSGLRVIEEGIEVGRQAERARLMAAQPAAKARALTDAECAAIEAETLQLVRRANATISSGVPYALGLAPVRPTEDPALARQAAAIVASLPKGA